MPDTTETQTLSLKGDRMFVHPFVRNIVRHLAVVVFVTTGLASMTASAQTYVQTNLISDIPGQAPTTDHLLVNPWGIARSANSPWWVADNATGVSTIYTGAGVPAQNPPGVQFVVNIPNAPSESGAASPTGIVSNSSSD